MSVALSDVGELQRVELAPSENIQDCGLDPRLVLQQHILDIFAKHRVEELFSVLDGGAIFE